MSISHEHVWYDPSHHERKSGSPHMNEVLPVVFVVDDDISVREALEALIGHEGWQPVIFSSARAFLDHPRVRVPSCMILDMNLPDLNGLDLQRLVAEERADMPIIFITGYGDVPTSVQAMKAGALEFLTKPFSEEVLVVAIADAISRSSQALLAHAATQEIRESFASLSRREQEVMALVVSGMLNRQIGALLGISEITVKAHRGKVMRKMKANSLADLIGLDRALNNKPQSGA